METFSLCRLRCLTLLCAVMANLNADFAVAMQVTSTGPQTIQKAGGESVVLGCTYTPGSSDTGQLDIEWSILNPDMTMKDSLILSFSGGKMYTYGQPDLTKRMNFTVADPQKGDASVSISNLKASDTNTYQCKVKKSPGVDSRKITLVVLVPPSVPRCWVSDGEEIGQPVKLLCRSNHGSTPLSYQWTRKNGASLPNMATQNAGTGELLIRNHSESYTGEYVCLAKNAVGQETCTYNLRAFPPTNKTAVIVGAVIGALLLLLLLLLLIWLLICCCRKRRYQKEVANEIREDALAPESRPASRNSSFRSVMGYRSHQGISYSSVYKAPLDMGSERGSMRSEGSRLQRTALPSSQGATYSSKYGYPV